MSFADKVEEVKAKVEESTSNIEIIQMASEKLGVHQIWIVFGLGFLVTAFLFFGFGAGLLCNLVGFVYPAYKSFKAIESEDKADDTVWLTYWVVYAAFNILESFSDYLLYWIPFYYAVKLGFLVWLFYPSTQGAKFLYDHVLREILQRGEHHIDKALTHASKASADLADVAAKAAPTTAPESKKAQ